MTWSLHIQSAFPWNEGESYNLSLAVLPHHFFPYKEICIKQVYWENDVVCVSSWWESKIFLSMCSLMLCGSVLFPAASPYSQCCSWMGSSGTMRQEEPLRYLTWPPAVLQQSLYFPRSSGCLCNVWSGAGYLTCSTLCLVVWSVFRENSFLRRK